MAHEVVNENRPSIVPRSSIPISEAPEDRGLEVRAFGAHEILGQVIPMSSVALAWTRVRAGQEVPLRSHETPGLLIVLEGSAELYGKALRAVAQGDVITIPGGYEYGFRNVGSTGLHALHVALAGDASEEVAEGASLKQLLAHNETRARGLLSNPFFVLLSSGGLDHPAKRAMMRECVRVYSDAYQTFLFTRQATCRDERYQEMFHEHFLEELGHNKLLSVKKNPRAFMDPVLRATATWFTHQLMVLDNADKAILNIALETAGYYFHTLAAPVFVGDESSQYFDIHAEADELHKELGIDLLKDAPPKQFKRLYRVLDEGWDMIDAMLGRMARLVELEVTRA